MIQDVLLDYLKDHTIKELMHEVIEAIKKSGRRN